MMWFLNKYRWSVFFTTISVLCILSELVWQYLDMDHPHGWLLPAVITTGVLSFLACGLANRKAYLKREVSR